MSIKENIRDLERLEAAIRGGPEARVQWLELLKREVIELLAQINREIESLSRPRKTVGDAEPSGAVSREAHG